MAFRSDGSACLSWDSDLTWMWNGLSPTRRIHTMRCCGISSSAGSTGTGTRSRQAIVPKFIPWPHPEPQSSEVLVYVRQERRGELLGMRSVIFPILDTG